RTARAFDSADDAHERALARLLPALAKYWHNKRGPGFMAEAMECLGGIGYVEETPLARLYREAPVNSIWEGSGNVICLDVLRIVARHPECIDALHRELAGARGVSGDYDRAVERLAQDLSRPAEEVEANARGVTQRMAQCLQAALLLRHAPDAVAHTFCRSRLGPEAGPVYGVLPYDSPLDAIVARILP
ncbi:MAG: acyl-CoA dehydrogenase family protein, partial [Halomonas sp.]|nr:acyl-CoA dehydrogenase family protein [Halomonas sp.]